MRNSENFEQSIEPEKALAADLKLIAEKLPFHARELKKDQLPKVQQENKYNGPELETAYFVSKDGKKLLYYGNAHGSIFPFLEDAVTKGIIGTLPLRQVLNVDFHADVATYSEHTTCHTASWQKFGVEKGFWSESNSYNWQPEHSTATRPKMYTTAIETDRVLELSPQLLSIDLDFFNDLSLEDPKFSKYLDILKVLVKRADCVSVFSSSGWTLEKLTQKVVEKIIQEIQNTFTEG